MPDIFKSITITDKARQELEQDLDNWFEAEGNLNDELKTSESRLAKLERVEKNLQQLAIEEEISIADFKEHRQRIEAERSRLKNMVDYTKQRQNLVKADFEIALQLATEFDFLYEKGTFDERRLLCETVFKRLFVKEGKVTRAELNAPFRLIASKSKGSESVLIGSPNRKEVILVPGNRLPFPSYVLDYPGGLPEIVGEYALTNPCVCPGTAPYPASLEPKLPLEQAYPGLNPGPEPLEPLEPGLLLVAPPLFSRLPSFRDTDPLDSASFEPVLIGLRVETPVGGHRL